MKMRWTLGMVALLMSGAVACSDAGSNDGLVARVGDYQLTVADVAELMVNEERLPAQVTVIRQVADLWIQYTLLGAAVWQDTSLSSIEFEALVRQQLDQLMIFELRDSVVQIDTVIADDELQELYAAEDPALEMRARHILMQCPAHPMRKAAEPAYNSRESATGSWPVNRSSRSLSSSARIGARRLLVEISAFSVVAT